MTRKSKRELRRALAALGADPDDGPGVNVFIGRFSVSSANDKYRVATDAPEDDPIDKSEKVAIPNHLPPSYRGGVTTLDEDDLRALWDDMPEDIREREREYRREHDEPIPPVLTEGKPPQEHPDTDP
jgi:hypothetical protein